MTSRTPQPTNPYASPVAEGPPPRLPPAAPYWRLHVLTFATYLSVPLYMAGVLMLFASDVGMDLVSLAGGLLCILCGLGGLACGVFVLWKGTVWHRVLVAPPTLYVLTQHAYPALYLLGNLLRNPLAL